MTVTRRLSIIALLVSGSAVQAAPLAGQRFGGVGVQTGMSATLPVGDRGFARAFDVGVAASVGLLFARGSWWRTWLDLELHAFQYDRRRFFDRIGLPSVDLETQLGAGFASWSALVGLDVVPWQIGVLTPYVRGGFGYINRDAGAAPILIHQYCTPASIITGGYIGPDPSFVAPAFCAEARREVGADLQGTAIQLGIGTSVRVSERLAGFVDIRITRPVSTSFLTWAPLRIGVVGHR